MQINHMRKVCKPLRYTVIANGFVLRYSYDDKQSAINCGQRLHHNLPAGSFVEVFDSSAIGHADFRLAYFTAQPPTQRQQADTINAQMRKVREQLAKHTR